MLALMSSAAASSTCLAGRPFQISWSACDVRCVNWGSSGFGLYAILACLFRLSRTVGRYVPPPHAAIVFCTSALSKIDLRVGLKLLYFRVASRRRCLLVAHWMRYQAASLFFDAEDMPS